MKQIILSILFSISTYLTHAQHNKNNCVVLKHFFYDSTLNSLFSNLNQVDDTIIIVDSTKQFLDCDFSSTKGHKVVVIYNNEINFDPANRLDSPKLRNVLLIYNLKKKRSKYEIYFFYKFTNALGSVKYKMKKSSIKNVAYNLGQL